MWAVTVTGAPKTWAMQFIEDHELTPRRWYGGAVGALGFDGNMNTGLTLRTAHIKDGLACVRTGATLLFDSDPAAEEAETRLKARALLEVLRQANEAQANAGNQMPWRKQSFAPAESPGQSPVQPPEARPGDGIRVLLVDHQDSFVHTLAAYFAEHGAQVTTLRAGFDPAILDDYAPDLVVLSPGPGRPSDFGCDELLAELDARRLAGVRCLPGPPGHGRARGRNARPLCRRPLTASRARCGSWAANCWPICPPSSRPAVTTHCTRPPTRSAPASRSRRRPATPASKS